MIRTIIFDMDGTMVNSKEANLKSLNKSIEKYNYPPISADDYEIAYSMSGRDVLSYFGVSDNDLDKMKEDWTVEMDKIREDALLFEGIEETLKELKARGYKLGVITSRESAGALKDIKRFNLSHYFEEIVTVSDIDNPKPHRDSLDLYISKTGEDIEKIIYVGDSIHDSDFAKNANIPFVLGLWGAVNPDVDATVKLEDPRDLLRYIEDQ